MVDTAKLMHIADCALDEPEDEEIVRGAVDEIVRLRAALESIIDIDYVGRGIDGPATAIAKRALEQTPTKPENAT